MDIEIKTKNFACHIHAFFTGQITLRCLLYCPISMLNPFHLVISWSAICGSENLVHIKTTSITKIKSRSEHEYIVCFVLMIFRVAMSMQKFFIFRGTVDICMDNLRMCKYHHAVTESKFQKMMHILFSNLAECLLMVIS